jgi:hypothetical protein
MEDPKRGLLSLIQLVFVLCEVHRIIHSSFSNALLCAYLPIIIFCTPKPSYTSHFFLGFPHSINVSVGKLTQKATTPILFPANNCLSLSRVCCITQKVTNSKPHEKSIKLPKSTAQSTLRQKTRENSKKCFHKLKGIISTVISRLMMPSEVPLTT